MFEQSPLNSASDFADEEEAIVEHNMDPPNSRAPKRRMRSNSDPSLIRESSMNFQDLKRPNLQMSRENSSIMDTGGNRSMDVEAATEMLLSLSNYNRPNLTSSTSSIKGSLSRGNSIKSSDSGGGIWLDSTPSLSDVYQSAASLNRQQAARNATQDDISLTVRSIIHISIKFNFS